MAQLEIKAAEMYLGSRGLFEGESKFCTISCKMRRKADAHHGEMVEIVSCAPLSCPMEIASSSLWRELTTLRTFPDKTYRYMQASSPNVMEKCFDQILRSNAAATPLNGLQVMKKFEEADRVVLVPKDATKDAVQARHSSTANAEDAEQFGCRERLHYLIKALRISSFGPRSIKGERF
ncbi:hypothetical protein PF001_g21415 [Phytophthora fragariae]|uniref:Uncharacterized protein n=1 Tax=Phytophthora fragariae TaxID=53985 RepID=A0A6A3E9D1_9STRA|nr:hypothetical protein PF009_g20993 [Phytophthora fragariae]KAE9104195.1 hypothetical protein PF006_g21972 [Phytophthora fragariae]KAE9200354.1 hypothetical protein PF004_g19028 [Phytophthora fragariae]KAE9286490.1 hypothetical protein PF001_g21415 [Phytophthora fragariae]KAE9303117.1 hypothetical protein PF008_g22307 [Phytophthora fragariae]